MVMVTMIKMMTMMISTMTRIMRILRMLTMMFEVAWRDFAHKFPQNCRKDDDNDVSGDDMM